MMDQPKVGPEWKRWDESYGGVGVGLIKRTRGATQGEARKYKQKQVEINSQMSEEMKGHQK